MKTSKFLNVHKLNPNTNSTKPIIFEDVRNDYLKKCDKTKSFAEKHRLKYKDTIKKLLQELETFVEKNKVSTSKEKDTSARKFINILERIRKSILYSGYAKNTVFNEFTKIKKIVVEILSTFTAGDSKKIHLDDEHMNCLMSKYLSAGKDFVKERKADYALSIRAKGNSLKTVKYSEVVGYTDFWINQLITGINKPSSRLFLGFAALTGRRLIEVVQTMELDFDTYNATDNTIMFCGQAKLPDESERRDEAYRIKLLITNDEQLTVLKQAYKQLMWYREQLISRDGQLIKEYDHRKFTNWAGSIRRTFNHEDYKPIKNILNNEFDTGIKNLRAFYVCYLHALHEEQFRKSKSNIQKQTFNVFSSNYLGHEKTDMSTANSYHRYAFK
jgi:hypothetical protein